jgi:hypothetical protein
VGAGARWGGAGPFAFCEEGSSQRRRWGWGHRGRVFACGWERGRWRKARAALVGFCQGYAEKLADSVREPEGAAFVCQG